MSVSPTLPGLRALFSHFACGICMFSRVLSPLPQKHTASQADVSTLAVSCDSALCDGLPSHPGRPLPRAPVLPGMGSRLAMMPLG